VPLASHTGLAEVQPASCAEPLAVFAQATHFSAELMPLHTPPEQALPAATGAKTHLPAVQASEVHSLPSLQSVAVVQPAHAASRPVPRQIGAVDEQPKS
jgi:hypothetical protein